MRVYILSAMVVFLAVYAWRDWFKSLCGLILLMAFIEHEDMPRNIMGIQGLNLWNMLLVVIVAAWLAHRRRQGLRWDMPLHLTVVLLLYLGVILAGFGREVADRGHLRDYTLSEMISEELINTIKWAVPGILLFDGCRTRRQLILAVVCILAVYLLLALQVARRIPAASAFGDNSMSMHYTRLKICRSIGYSSVDMSTFLSGACWATLALSPLMRRRWQKLLVLGAAAFIVYAQALTGGRAGYFAWGAVGLVMCLIRWRRYLLLAPIMPVVLYFALPGAADRMLEGFSGPNASGQETVDANAVTSDRLVMWPHVIDKIEESPAFGYGRLAMVRTGLSAQMLSQELVFAHPHNMYLEWLLDNGVLGLLPVALFFVIVLACSIHLFCDRASPWLGAVGGITLALVLCQLFAGVGSQHLYPGTSTLGMWSSIFLMLRVWQERSKAHQEARRAMAVQRMWMRLGGAAAGTLAGEPSWA